MPFAHFGLVEGPCRLDQLLPRPALQRVRVRAVVVLVQAPAPVLQSITSFVGTVAIYGDPDATGNL